MTRAAGLAESSPVLVQPFSRVSGVNEFADGANETPSSEVKHWALPQTPPSASTLTEPSGWMNKSPLVAPHRSTGTKTLRGGRSPAGKVNATWLIPFVVMAPSRWTMPEILRAAGLAVPDPYLTQPFLSFSGVNEAADLANETPSSEVKHWALAQVAPSSASTV